MTFLRALLLLFVLLAVGVAVAWKLERPRLDAYLDSETFRKKIAEATSKGLKVEGDFAPLHHQGCDAWTDSFHSKGRPGEAIAALDAETITARFNPWGIFLRRWQVDRITIAHATLTLRPPDPKKKVPLHAPPRPWYVWIMPQKFYLKEVLTPDAQVLWKMEGQMAGLRHVPMRVTPYGEKDWRFTGNGGTFEMPQLPLQRVADLSFIVTKPYLIVERATLTPPEEGDPGWLKVRGFAGMQPEDEHVEAQATFDDLPLKSWVYPPWRDRLRGGRIGGNLMWNGPRALQGGWGKGDFTVRDVVFGHTLALRFLALLSHNKDWADLHVKEAKASWEWRDPVFNVDGLVAEAPGLCRLEGEFRVEKGRLTGIIRLGVEPKSLAWLPKDGQGLFTQDPERSASYRWAVAHLSGTAEQPVDDLTPKLRHAIVTSPGTLLKMGLEGAAATLGGGG